MQIDTTRITSFVDQFTRQGYWVETTTNEVLERNARVFPDKVALVDYRRRLTYSEYFQMAQRLSAYWLQLGLTRDDAIAVQLPNWNEFVITVNAAKLVGIPFCQFHVDLRSREVEFILNFIDAAVLVIPRRTKKFDHLAMIRDLRPRLSKLKHILLVGEDIPSDMFDLRSFLESNLPMHIPEEKLLRYRPHGNDLERVCFTSGTTGDPKAVIHTHNTTNSACKFVNRDHLITPDSAVLLFLPVGLNWGLVNTVQAVLAGCKLVLMDGFRPEEALQLIESERITHFYTTPTALIGLLKVPNLNRYDRSSLKVVVVGGAACPIEVIRQWRANMPGHLLELYGMLESGASTHTMITDDPEEVCGLVGRPLPEVGVKVVDENGKEVPPGTVGEIATFAPSVTIGYYKNPKANESSFTPDGWLLTGDLGVFDEKGYLRVTGRKKDLIIRGGANIYPREIEELLFQHPKVQDVAVIGIPDPYLGERTCACILPNPGEQITLGEVIDFLRDKVGTYKLPEWLEIVNDFPRTAMGKIQKTVLRNEIIKKLNLSQES